MRENKNLEFKEKVTNTFLKTVSAYANYGTGEILFGVSDRGEIKGIENPVQICLDIENRINDSMSPVPNYHIEINSKTSVIRLVVEEGLHKPYLYKSKAYRRNDSASIEVDRIELTRLILEGTDSSYEELASKKKELSFHTLEEKLKEALHLSTFSMDTLKTLELYSDSKGLNIAAELLADENTYCGTDIVRFGDSNNIILDRETFERISILDQYDKTISMYKKYYQYDEIKGFDRSTISLIPEEAFREAIANALVHRTWDVQAHISVAMYPDRIEITSPGGLPKGMHEDEYFRGGISVLRNRIIGNIFLRLQMIERFGTGIRRIQESYDNSSTKPAFEIRDHSIKIILPVYSNKNGLSVDENKVYQLLKRRIAASSYIVEKTGFGKSKVVSILNKLVVEGYIQQIGNGRGIKYSAK